MIVIIIDDDRSVEVIEEIPVNEELGEVENMVLTAAKEYKA
jgi:hypothetical protein